MEENGFTLKFSDNLNKKLYSKYFLVIRPYNHFGKNGMMIEIELKGKIIMCARVINCEIVKFQELPHALTSLDTGLNHSDSLQHYKRLGIDVTRLDEKVKLMLIEAIDYTKQKDI